MNTQNKIIIPEISVIICSYNHEKWIERCIKSLLIQKNIKKNQFEIILVNDASKDNTKKILRKYSKFKNLNIINNKKNIGLPGSLNKGIKKSIGRYIVRVDSDDYVNKYFLFLMKFFLDIYKNFQAVEVDYFKVDSKDKIITFSKYKKESIACGIMFRRESLFNLGLYNKKFKMREGHDLRKRFLERFKMGKLNLPLYNYRMHSLNRTKKKNIKNYNEMLKKI